MSIEPTDNELNDRLSEILDKGFSEHAMAAAKSQIESLCCDLSADLEYNVKSDLSYNLCSWVRDMAGRVIEDILKGDEEAMRRHLSCQEGHYTGRDRDHSVIHGRLFETGAVELRKRIVEAHADLLKNERILDLEDQVKSLVDQVNKLERRNQETIERMNQYMPR